MIGGSGFKQPGMNHFDLKVTLLGFEAGGFGAFSAMFYEDFRRFINLRFGLFCIFGVCGLLFHPLVRSKLVSLSS